MRKGLTLLEMLIVIGIISALVAASLGGYQHVLKSGERARAHELVTNAATALTAYFEREGSWPKAIRDAETANDGGQLLNETVAWYLRKDFSVDVASDANDDLAESGKRKTIGLDRFGIVTPWATTKLKKLGADELQGKEAKGIVVSEGATVHDHILRFAVDLDGDGLIENVKIGGGSSVSIRATAAVWCCSKNGKIESYAKGVRADGIYSWAYGQTVSTK